MAEKKNKNNPLNVTMKQVHIAAENLRFDSDLFEKDRWTKRKMIIHFPVKMNDGKIKVFIEGTAFSTI